MIDILKLSQGEQYALIGIAVFFLNKLYHSKITRYELREYLYLTLITVTFILAVWVSDLALLTTGLIIALFSISFVWRIKELVFSNIFKKPEFYFLIFGFVVGVLFLYFAKSNARQLDNYYEFFDPKTMLASLSVFFESLRDVFLFKINEPFTSLYTYLLLTGIAIVAFQARKVSLSKNDRRWAVIFALDFILILVIIFSSKWANANGVPRRYFVCSYISFWIVFLLVIDNLQIIKRKLWLNGFIAFTVLIGGLGTIYNFKYISPKSLKPTIKTASEFKSLGKIGLIAEYWNSYINSAPDPENIKATPHDRSAVRNKSMVDSVFSQPNIYVIRDMWMDVFPDTLRQFGYTLIKDGNEFNLGNCQVCKYTKNKLNETFNLDILKYSSTLTPIYDEGKTVLHISPACKTCIKKIVVHGPKITIGSGDYIARYYLKTTESAGSDTLAWLSITADHGKTQLVTKGISPSDFSRPDHYEYIDLEFYAPKGLSNVESRIIYTGIGDLFFEHVRLIEK